MNWKQIITTVVLCVVVSFAVVSFKQPSGTDSNVKKETAYERVLRTNTLRCAWATAIPMAYKDNKTNELVGAYVKIAEKMAEKLGLKIEWTSEVGFADFAEGLKTSRYDAFCGVITMAPQRARVVRFSEALAYYPFEVYVRKGDTRFKTIEDMNKPDVRAGTIDGEVFQIMTRKNLPKAKEVSLPNMTSDNQLFVDLKHNKIDILIHSPVAYRDYEKNNGDVLDKVFDKPIELYPVGMAVLPTEHELADMMNIALRSLQIMGVVDKILNEYNLTKDVHWRLAAPYQAVDVED